MRRVALLALQSLLIWGGGSVLGSSSPISTPGFVGIDFSDTFIEIVLNEAAIDQINQAAGGLFAVGLKLDEISIVVGTLEFLRFSSGKRKPDSSAYLGAEGP